MPQANTVVVGGDQALVYATTTELSVITSWSTRTGLIGAAVADGQDFDMMATTTTSTIPSPFGSGRQ